MIADWGDLLRPTTGIVLKVYICHLGIISETIRPFEDYRKSLSHMVQLHHVVVSVLTVLCGNIVIVGVRRTRRG